MILHWLPLQSGGQNPNALCNLFPFLPARSFLCKLLTTLALSLWLQQTQLTHLGLALDNPVWNHLPLLRHPSFHAGLCSHVTTQAFPVPRPQSPSLLLVSFPVMSTIIFHLSYSLLNPCCPEVCQAQIWHSINTCWMENKYKCLLDFKKSLPAEKSELSRGIRIHRHGRARVRMSRGCREHLSGSLQHSIKHERGKIPAI